jgi:hypothetical protein
LLRIFMLCSLLLDAGVDEDGAGQRSATGATSANLGTNLHCRAPCRDQICDQICGSMVMTIGPPQERPARTLLRIFMFELLLAWECYLVGRPPQLRPARTLVRIVMFELLDC